MNRIIALSFVFAWQLGFAAEAIYKISDNQQISYRPITAMQFAQAKEIIAKIDYLNFDEESNCEARAFWSLWELKAKGIAASIVHISGHRLVREWMYHVVAGVFVEGEKEPFIFDRSIAPTGPLPLSKWIKQVSMNSSWSIWGSYSDKDTGQVVNHYCSVIENPKGKKVIRGVGDKNLSLHARRLFMELERKELIEWGTDTFTCTDQGLDWQ